jgi:hypothetical protein
MAEFGCTVPVFADSSGEVIAGHGRILAAAQLGMKDIPVTVLDHLTEAHGGPTASRTTTYGMTRLSRRLCNWRIYMA